MVQLPVPRGGSAAGKPSLRVPVVVLGSGDRREPGRDGSRGCTRADLRSKAETRAFLLLLDQVGTFR
jgi:hypothetical protein